MVPILTGDILQLRVFCSAGDQLGLNVRHLKVITPGDVVLDLDAVAAAYATLLGPLYKAVLSTGAAFRGVGVKRLLPIPETVEAFSVVNAGVGTIAGDILPTGVSGLISLRTIRAGRNNRGRMYIPFPSEASNGAAGQPIPAYLTSLTNIAGQFTGTLDLPSTVTDARVQNVVFNRLTGLTVDIVSTQRPPKWATQRRRGDFGATNTIPV